jgi:hypothetical protein
MPLAAIFGHRQVILALFVAPLLAVGTWFGVGWIAADPGGQREPPQSGHRYPLLELSGCRYGGGVCRLQNGDVVFYVDITPEGLASVRGNIRVDHVVVALDTTPEGTVYRAEPLRDQEEHWQVQFPPDLTFARSMRIVIGSGGARYFGEASLAFIGPREPLN